MSMTAAERQQRIDLYERGPLRLHDALNLVPDEAVKWRPAPGKWSAHEVVCHCADSETNGYARIRFLVAEKSATLQGYDQETWAVVFDYHALPLEPALAVVETIRGSTAALIRGLPDEAWTRVGHHTESGRYGAEDWLHMYADHLEIHARQIENNVAQWKSASPSR